MQALCEPWTPQERVDQADIVVTGTVALLWEEPTWGRVESDPPAPEPRYVPAGSCYKAVVSVDRYLKGIGKGLLLVGDAEIYSVLGETSLGGDYILFLRKISSRDAYWTDACAGSWPLHDERTDLASILAVTGQGTPPMDAPDTPSPWVPVVLGSGGLAAGLVLGAFLWRMRSRSTAP